ncbi:hypothetical protein [Leptolinea tardivitalis]|uniref:Uncharacterized protein n=1 Tax=Leptolinea tardivitalis TaxID=229920 RepID=A0A0P6X071_9CHLR|nr:hypothetical protein [Leptolinea tardivitalis]KPL72589.1 hypothetical protein ADM99_05625 [Leptolinea tardivitalis]GAP21099.1 hypothetical protein LTAR_01305 [Leptolinea tardivitalis]
MHTRIQIIIKYAGIFACVASCGLAIFSAIKGYEAAIEYSSNPPETDMVTDWDRRLRKFRLDLPESGIVGYLSDRDIPGYKYGIRDEEVEFILTQYTLAPVVLERGANHKVVVGNFRDDGDPEKIKRVEKELNVKLIKAYSNEIFLLEGNEK